MISKTQVRWHKHIYIYIGDFPSFSGTHDWIYFPTLRLCLRLQVWFCFAINLESCIIQWLAIVPTLIGRHGSISCVPDRKIGVAIMDLNLPLY